MEASNLECGQHGLRGQMTAYNFHQIDTHYETHDELENVHNSLSNMKLFGFTRRKMILIAICLTKSIMKIRIYPDFSL